MGIPPAPHGVHRFPPEPIETSTESHRAQTLPTKADDVPGSAPLVLGEHQTHQEEGKRQEIDAKSRPEGSLPCPEETAVPYSAKNDDKADQSTSIATGPSYPTSLPLIESTPPNQTSLQDAANDGRPAGEFDQQSAEPAQTSWRPRACAHDSNSGEQTKPDAPLRKFKPQLVETAKRSFRKLGGDRQPDVADDNRSSAGHNGRPNRGMDTDIAGQRGTNASGVSPFDQSESRFSYVSLLERQQSQRRSHYAEDSSGIPSSNGEGSESSHTWSPATSQSSFHDMGMKRLKLADQSRDHYSGGRSSGPILSLAAKKAERQLRDQALAAFPNEHSHHSVDHFAIDGGDDSENEDRNRGRLLPPDRATSVSFRRGSAEDLPRELSIMRRHKEEAELREYEARQGESSDAKAPAPAAAPKQDADKHRFGWQQDQGLKNKVSPPLLGQDIVFPFSQSPKGTQCESDSEEVSTAQETKQAEGGMHNGGGGLWCKPSGGKQGQGAGLWMGLCRGDNHQPPQYRPGIVTPSPQAEGESYLSLDTLQQSIPTVQTVVTPPTPDHDDGDRSVDIESEIDREFHDGFVTQVYNYLSLGYPSVAYYFDEELSKISGIPVEELRRDDSRTKPVGHIGVSEGTAGTASGSHAGDDDGTIRKCPRWTALRLYIREWARQRLLWGGFQDNCHDAWGVRERKGSWAF